MLQAHRFLADHLPVVGQRLQLRENFFVEIGLPGGQTGETGHKHIDRPHKGGVIEQLAGKLLFLLAAGVCVKEADDKTPIMMTATIESIPVITDYYEVKT